MAIIRSWKKSQSSINDIFTSDQKPTSQRETVPDSPHLAFQPLIAPFQSENVKNTIEKIWEKPSQEQLHALLAAFRTFILSYQIVFNQLWDAIDQEKITYKHTGILAGCMELENYLFRFNSDGVISSELYLAAIKIKMRGVATICDEIKDKFNRRCYSEILDVIDTQLIPMASGGTQGKDFGLLSKSCPSTNQEEEIQKRKYIEQALYTTIFPEPRQRHVKARRRSATPALIPLRLHEADL